MPGESTRTGAGPSWPLRVVLGLCVTALVVVGFQLKDGHRSPAATPTSTMHVTPSTTATPPTRKNGTASTTTTHPTTPLTNLPPPVVNMTAFKPPGAGRQSTAGARWFECGHVDDRRADSERY